MPKYNIRKLPAGFSYVINKKDIRDILQQYESIVDRVEFSGISNSEPKSSSREFKKGKRDMFSVGYAKTRYIENKWSVALDFVGLRDSSINNDRDQIANILITDIKSFLDRVAKYPPTEPRREINYSFIFIREGEEIISASHDWEVSICRAIDFSRKRQRAGKPHH